MTRLPDGPQGSAVRRRAVLLGSGAVLLGAGAAAPGDDGLFHEPWFLESFLDLHEDQEAAASAGRRLAVLWELRGCPACRQLHEDTLSDARVAAATRARLDVVLLDIIGARPVTPPRGSATGGPTGGAVAERALARAWGVRGTPTLQVLARAGEMPGGRIEAARLEGFVPPDAMLAWLAALPPLPAQG